MQLFLVPSFDVMFVQILLFLKTSAAGTYYYTVCILWETCRKMILMEGNANVVI